jgi:transposase-like protein
MRGPSSRSRRLALAGGAALVLGGATAGMAGAAQRAQPEADTSLSSDQDVLLYAPAPPADMAQQQAAWTSALAAKLGVTPDKLKQALADVRNELGLPAGPVVLVPGLPIGGLPGPGVRIEIDPGLGAAASALHISEDQLRHERQTRSLADVARAHGVEPQVVADAIKARRVADLDAAVRESKLPAEMADRIKSHLDEEIEHLLNAIPGTGPTIIRFERGITPP